MDGRGKIWVFSDPHFYDYSILKYERKQFATIEEHNNFIVDNINKCATEKDTVICLGDLGFDWYKYIDRIHAAKKILVLGNHDRNSRDIYYDHFDMVFDGPVFLNKFIVLSHEPWPGCGEYCMNIHGHLHNSHLDKPFYFNANVAQTNYAPIDANDIFKNNSSLKRNNERFLREWYAKDYVFDYDHLGRQPVRNHRLIAGFEKIPQIIDEYNLKHKTKFYLKDINWENYDEKKDDMKTYIFNFLKAEEERRSNAE